jgi:hypothetical protein
MFEGDFGEKCIIVHFFGGKKRRKSYERRVRRGAEKGFEEDHRAGKHKSKSGASEFGMTLCADGRAGMKMKCSDDDGVSILEAAVPLSPLLAHTSTTERRKSFISTHIAK